MRQISDPRWRYAKLTSLDGPLSYLSAIVTLSRQTVEDSTVEGEPVPLIGIEDSTGVGPLGYHMWRVEHGRVVGKMDTADSRRVSKMAKATEKFKTASVRAHVARKRGGPLYVGVVVRVGDSLMQGGLGLTSYRDDAKFSAALGYDKDDLIAEGMKLVSKYGAERYDLVVGTITERVKQPVPKYKVSKL